MLKQVINIFFLIFLLTEFLFSCRTKENSIEDEPYKTKKEYINYTVVPQDSIIEWNYQGKSNVENVKIYSEKPKLRSIDYYEKGYSELENMLLKRSPLDFKRAVFISENAFYGDSLKYENFIGTISSLSEICRKISTSVFLKDYNFSDSLKLKKNYAIFLLIKDTINLNGIGMQLLPYTYDFEDNLGTKNWSSTFVTKLVNTGEGNCHSLPYLYKILANELNTEAYLSLAPNHLYLKHKSKSLGWYNTELTSGEFPTDAWIKASGYITIDAIRSGIYMDTLSQEQSVALCLYDLAKGYSVKNKINNDGFIIKCCDLVLKYYPHHINTIILKAETIKKLYLELSKEGKTDESIKYYNEMQKLYMLGLKLGYREMPKEMYQAWINSTKNEKDKNKEINRTFNQTK